MRKPEESRQEKPPVAQIKSKKRVKDFAEVFTNEREVKAMCDLIPAEIWENIASTFLEPACGNGNFLVEIMARKYSHCQNPTEGVIALSSVVGIDIQPDNCEECRERLFEQFKAAFPNACKIYTRLAEAILARNIICGDSLEIQKRWSGG